MTRDVPVFFPCRRLAGTDALAWREARGLEWVIKPIEIAETEAMRLSIARGRTYGSAKGMAETVKTRFGHAFLGRDHSPGR